MIQSDGKLYFGTVISTQDPLGEGWLKVKCPEFNSQQLEVKYTSPYYSRNNGGMLAIPDEGSDIIFCSIDGKFFYLSTILDIPSSFNPGGLKEWKVIADKYTYTGRQKPQKVSFTNSNGAGLKISDRILPTYIASKVELVSRLGKKLLLSDSPLMDVTMLRNEHGDGIAISSDPNEVYSERSIEVKSKGAQRYVVFQSDMHFSVIDGRDLTIENLSTGSFAGPGDNGRYGNVNIRSHVADINIVGKGGDSRIFITTPKARIQIQADGSVLIESVGDIQLKTQGNLDIEADKAIRIKGESLDITTTTGDIKFKSAGGFGADCSSRVALDGSEIHLNSGFRQGATAPQLEDPEKTDYQE